MTQLEHELVALGAELAYPETPDIAGAVRIRLAPARRRRLSGRRTLVLAFVALVLAVGAALAVPPARSAILDFFGLRGATVRRVETLPPVPAGTKAALQLGDRVPIEDGRPQVEFPKVLVPGALGPPDAAYVATTLFGERLSLVYNPGPGLPRSRYSGVGLLLTEFAGSLDTTHVEKMVGAGTPIERLTVSGSRALWIEGGPHVVIFRTPGGGFAEDQARLAGNTLLLERGPLLVRIEGDIDRDRAVAIAESLE
jgi:hypothetical protein